MAVSASPLARAALAAGARAPVCCLVGDGGRARARALRLDARVRVVSSPRHATVVVVVGQLPPPLHAAALQVHDQVPAPRGVVVWAGGRGEPFPEAVRVEEGGDVGAAIVALHRALVRGEHPSSEPWGPASSPVPWRGVGPHGQGGEGMMGGKPYGRAMAMTGADVRDGLQLDRVAVTVGPFLPWLPPGLRLHLELQGDVIAALEPRVPPLRREDWPEPFRRARSQTVSLAELELERARHHLAATADLLLVLGLGALAERTLRLAATVQPRDAERVRRLHWRLRRSGALWLATRGIGRLPSERIAGLGPVARAAGREEDARCEDPAYQRLGFRPHVGRGGDANARWQQRLVEAADALELAQRAGDSQRSPGAPLEGPRGAMEARAGGAWLELLAEVARGQAWDAFVTTLVSLDLDPAALPVTGEYEQAPDEDEHGHETEEDGEDEDEDESDDEDEEEDDTTGGAYACPK